MSNSRGGIETSRLIEKIDKVINLYETSLKTIERQKEEMQYLKEEMQYLKEELQSLKSENRELQERLKNSKLASAMKSGERNEEAEAKINRLLREVDSCIALLNR